MSEELPGRKFDPHNIADHAEFYASHGMHLDDMIKLFKKGEANANWFLQHFDEIMDKHKGHHILVADQVLYAVHISEDLGNFYKNLREKGVDVSTGFTWYVPKDEDPEEIKKYWIHKPHFLKIDGVARYLNETENWNDS